MSRWVIKTWLLIVLNLLICCWDGWVSGIIWGSARNNLEKLLAVSAFVIGYVGFAYTIVLIAVATGYLGTEWLVATNVYMGLPLLLTGIIITAHSVMQAIRTRSISSILVSIWNCFATFHNIRVWFASVKYLKELGGLKKLLKSDSKKSIYMVLLVGFIMSTLVIYGLFRHGEEYSRNKEFIPPPG